MPTHFILNDLVMMFKFRFLFKFKNRMEGKKSRKMKIENGNDFARSIK